MVSIEFNYNQANFTIQANLSDNFEQVLQKFFQKVLIPPESVYFVSNASIIDPNLTVEKQIDEYGKENNIMKVIVFSIEEEKEKEIYIKSKEIICPKCYEPCRIKFENCKIKLYDCINGHIIDDIKINEFNKKQQINASKIICDMCQENNKGNTTDNKFYKCLTCKQNLCPLCKEKHGFNMNNHNIIQYEDKYYMCQKHNEKYIKYCNNCKLNLCFICEEEHQSHDIISLGNLIPNENDINERLLKIKKKIDVFKDEINEVIKKLNELIKTMDLLYEINYDIYKIYNFKTRNYETLQNINEIYINNPIIEKITEINDIPNLSDKVFNMLELYNELYLDKNELDMIKIKNKQKEKDIIYKTISISLVGNEIILNQLKKSVCKIINSKGKIGIGLFVKIPYQKESINTIITNLEIFKLEEIKLELSDSYEKKHKRIFLDDKRIKCINNKYEINIIEVKSDIDKIYNFIELDENIINNIGADDTKFYNKYINEGIYIIQNYNDNYNDMIISYEIFNSNTKYKYFSFSPILLLKNNKLIEINQKSKNNNLLIIDLINEFYKEIKIYENNKIKEKEIIQKKEIEKKIDTKGLNSLTIKYNIPKYNNGRIKIFGTIFVKDNINNFYLLIGDKKHDLCEYLELNKEQKEKEELTITLVQKEEAWSLKYMFHDCNLLKSLPDLYKFNTNNITDISYMFSNCGSLISISDISHLKTKNVTKMKGMFYYCGALQSLPDISNWDTSNVTDMSSMFGFCKSLRSLPDISKWITSSVNNMSWMFEDCSSLQNLPDISKWNTKSLTSINGMFKNCSGLKSFPDITRWNLFNIKEKEDVLKGVNKKIIPKKVLYASCSIF